MSTALYRRYRPDTFADVIGQEHVTTPLMAALEKNRVNHAYLFSGPRGCGKTTSARILARCLNCEQGPTAMPCGTCDSCVELATGGPGSLDVIEIDAASHGGVDDARDLRERATFAPVRDRYKIFIIDEAHMVTSAGFNALLKIVEEPPEHIKFIFATTEPDKVIGTIRSRTHHYPFRLVPPEPLMAYLEKLSESEGVPVAPGVLSLVVRAGGGSVRDSLSVLDQLIAGAGPDGLDYELAVSLLGYTHASLLDDVVDAMAAQDASVVFGAVDRVIQTGHDPRRFVEDLLERFRDLIIVKAMPDNAAQIIRGLPEDQLNRMRQQATQLGQAELSRSADVTNQALTEMTGATSPRLHLELLCARLLLPASDATERGINARIDRIDRRLAYAGDLPAGGSAPLAGQPTAGQTDSGRRIAGTPPDTSESSPGSPFESPREQGAAQVREALRSARKQDVDVRPADIGPADVLQGPPTARGSVSEETTEVAIPAQPPATEPVEAESAARPAAAAAPQASPDWGGSWGAVPDPQPEKPEPARSAPVAPTPGREDRTSVPEQRVEEQRLEEQRLEQRPRPEKPTQTTPAAAAPATRPAPAQGPTPATPVAERVADTPPTATASGTPAAGSIEMFRRAWPEIMAALKEEKKFVWLTIQPHASLAGYDGRTLTVAFANPGPMNAFSGKAENVGLLQQSIHKVLGVKCEIVITAGGSAPAGGSGPKADRRPTPAAAPATHRTGTSTPGNDSPAAGERVAAAHRPPSERATKPAPREAPAAGPAPAPAHALASRRATPAAQASATKEPPTRQSPTGQAPPGGPGRKTAPGPAVDDFPDYGPEPEDEGGYDWGVENVPVPDWELPGGDSVPTAVAPARQSTPPQPAASVPSSPAPSAAAGAKGGPAAPQQAGPAAIAPAPSAPAAMVPKPGEKAAAPAPGQPFPVPGTTPSAASASVPSAPAPAAPAPSPAGAGQKRMSRYQQLLSQARESGGPDARTQQPATPLGQTAGAATAAAGNNAVDSKYVEDIPSDDDIAIEESGVVGRPAIERLLNGRLIEERNHDGSPVT